METNSTKATIDISSIDWDENIDRLDYAFSEDKTHYFIGKYA